MLDGVGLTCADDKKHCFGVTDSSVIKQSINFLARIDSWRVDWSWQ